MADAVHRLPAYAGFGERRFPVEVIVVWRISGGWHLSTLLYRSHDGPVAIHPLSTEPFDSSSSPRQPDVEWSYLAERLQEGRGGNSYTYEVEGFEVADLAHIESIVTARAAEIVAATFGPMGEIAGTMITDRGSAATTVIPFVVVMDDSGDRFLVATQHLGASTPCEVRTEAGKPTDQVTFESLVNWQRSGARSWPVGPQTTYRLTWGDQTVRFALNDDGWADVRPVSATGDGVPETSSWMASPPPS
ncbi:MAG: hypothetical protein M3011_09045 [Actinomycetota bacterium]|nr:hypothetical protein [Actinomycetota bacterium]